MSKNLAPKYYQENKERLQKKLAKDIKIFLKEKYKMFLISQSFFEGQYTQNKLISFATMQSD